LSLPAAFNPGQAMLRDFESGLRQVEHLTALKDVVCLVGTELTTTAGTVLRKVNGDEIGVFYPLERLAPVPCLPAIRFLVRLWQSGRGGFFLEPVTAGRLVAIRAIHTQTTTQLGIFCLDLVDFG
jgi:hypothetical protein